MLHNDFPSPLYSPFGIEYQQAYSGSYKDLSYSVNGTTVIAALKDGRITGFGRPVFATGPKLKQAFERLYKISPDIYYMDYLEGGWLSAAGKLLLQKGLAAKPYYTQIIDLSKTEAELHTNLRKSYKSLINKDGPYIAVGFDSFRQLHLKAAGRKTRPDKTWDIQQKQLTSGEAFIVLNKLGNSGAFFIYNNHTCYYGVGCSVEGANSHAIIWKAILHAKELGCKFFEIGEQIFSGNEKLIGISKFKRGFGGETVTRLITEKKE